MWPMSLRPTGIRAGASEQAPSMDSTGGAEFSLDPADWDSFRTLCHRMLDAALDSVENLRAGPVWRPVPDHIREELAQSAPRAPQGAEEVCRDALRLVLPYPTGNIHPRFFGWVHGAGTPGGIIAELLAAAMNANVGGRDHGAVYVERQVIAWCREIFGFPAHASGLLVSGTSMATLIGLTVARNHLAGHDVRRLGLGAAATTLRAYTSAEAHGSVAKAFELLGLGRESLRPIAVDENYRIRLDVLRAAIAEDGRKGLRPFCVVGTAGTVNTGAIDDLAAIAEICAEHGLWFHIDGAFGALAVLDSGSRARLAGIERADSLAFDFHKWLHVPYDAGCVLVRREDLHRQAFASRPDYLGGAARGLAGGEPWFCDYGPELSRGFRAFKVWFTLKEHGLERLGEKIAENCRQARYLAERVQAHPELELLAPVTLNIVCFRVIGQTASLGEQNRLNGEIVADLHERGIAAPSTTRLGGKLAIRVCICNHRTQRADLDVLVDAVLALARERASDPCP